MAVFDPLNEMALCDGDKDTTLVLSFIEKLIPQRTDRNDLENEIAKINLDKVENDLMSFSQSSDLFSLNKTDYPAVWKFLNLMETTIRDIVEDKFRIKTKRITSTVSKYQKGDYLLCHDDLSGTRAVAFVYYVNTLEKYDGGDLRFFCLSHEQDPVNGRYRRRMTPVANRLVLFRVNKTSYHEVEQMYTDKTRITINGWYHFETPKDGNDVEFIKTYRKTPVVHLSQPVKQILPTKSICSKFFSKAYLVAVAKAFKNTVEEAILLDEILKKDFFDECSTVLKSSECIWADKGPANFRNYQTLPFEVFGSHIDFGESFYCIGNLVDFLLSEYFLGVLSTITGATYAVYSPNCYPPASMIEVQRWKEGSYSLLCDNDIERDTPTIDVTVFFGIQEELVNDDTGLIVRTMKYPKLTRADQKQLIQSKMKRMAHHRLLNRSEKVSKKMEVKLASNDASIIQEKIQQIQNYREKKNEDTSYFAIRGNNMLITMGGKDKAKYVTYIRKRSASSDDVCFYAISVTYFITE